MRAILEDNQWVWFDNITNAEEEILWVEFSITKPGMYVDPSQRGTWDGIYRKYNRFKKRIARPLLSMLKGICKKHNLPLVIVDKREKWPYEKMKAEDITADFLPGITLDPHQIRGIQAACNIECGVADIPTGGGKCCTSESKIYIEELGEIQIGTLFDGFQDEEYCPIDGLRVKYPCGMVDVIALYKTNKRKIMRLELESGRWLRGIPEHRVFTKRGWIMLKDLIANDEVAVDD